ncbi:MAG: AAA family ATPase [Pseudanabaena sp.]|jgi:predicted ATPase
MKLKSVSIRGLNNKLDCDREFHNDINIVTGINGSGKTTFLKILWYAISGNIESLISEISFKSFNLETSNFSLSLINKGIGIEWQYVANEIKQSGDINLYEYNSVERLELLKSLILETRDSSLFFPTFRRIEGSYSIVNPQTPKSILTQPTIPDLNIPIPFPFMGSKLQSEGRKNATNIKNEFDKLSILLSTSGHKFICSISTHDLGLLLKSHDEQISQKINEDFLRLSALLSSQIPNGKQDASAILSRIQQENNSVNNKRNELLRPFEILSELVTKVMHYKGIKLDNFILGESDDAIDARLLSYGEQQMLSFLCYNAFYENSVIFIDEPELSLHPDWQRILFSRLMKQQSSNQFIVATHSPFIYSNYEDKEIILDEEKGG